MCTIRGGCEDVVEVENLDSVGTEAKSLASSTEADCPLFFVEARPTNQSVMLRIHDSLDKDCLPAKKAILQIRAKNDPHSHLNYRRRCSKRLVGEGQRLQGLPHKPYFSNSLKTQRG